MNNLQSSLFAENNIAKIRSCQQLPSIESSVKKNHSKITEEINNSKEHRITILPMKMPSINKYGSDSFSKLNKLKRKSDETKSRRSTFATSCSQTSIKRRTLE